MIKMKNIFVYKMENVVHHCDLFAGTGGFSLGLKTSLGCKTVYANDIDGNCAKTYDLNNEIKITFKK